MVGRDYEASRPSPWSEPERTVSISRDFGGFRYATTQPAMG